MKHLLVVFHSQTGHTERLAAAAASGAAATEAGQVAVRTVRALTAGVEDLLWADGLILCTPENFGYMSGGMKDFLDRVYYPCEGLREGLPFVVIVSAGNDGQGAYNSIRRIARGFPWREIHQPIIVKGEPTEQTLAECTDLGAALAAGVAMGIF